MQNSILYPNPNDDTRTKIIKGAAHVFVNQGYARATTRALAQSAGVSEVTLFRIFESKEKLFASMVELYGGPKITDTIESELTGDYREDLLRIARYFMQIVLERREFVRMLLCEAKHFPELDAILSQNPRLLRETVARYLERQMERSLLRPLIPDIAAQAFWGMFFTYGLLLDPAKEIFPGTMTIDDVIVQFVDIFINGTIKQDITDGKSPLHA